MQTGTKTIKEQTVEMCQDLGVCYDDYNQMDLSEQYDLRERHRNMTKFEKQFRKEKKIIEDFNDLINSRKDISLMMKVALKNHLYKTQKEVSDLLMILNYEEGK